MIQFFLGVYFQLAGPTHVEICRRRLRRLGKANVQKLNFAEMSSCVLTAYDHGIIFDKIFSFYSLVVVRLPWGGGK